MAAEVSSLSGYQKVAVLLIALDVDTSAQVLRSLPDEVVERVSAEISRMQTLPESLTVRVLEEARGLLLAVQSLDRGGLPYAREVLQKAFTTDVAENLLARLTRQSNPGPFDFLCDSDPYVLESFLEHERPQTVAAVLAHLGPNETAAILERLPRDAKGEVVMRLATMDQLAPEVVKALARSIADKQARALNQQMTSVGGTEFLARVLNRADRGTERRVLEWLDGCNHELAEKIRQQILVFENLAQLDDRAMQRVLREVDLRDLALALKTASEPMKELIFKNLSSRMAAALRDEIASLGPVAIKVVEQAQGRMMEVVRRLEQEEEIVLARDDEWVQ